MVRKRIGNTLKFVFYPTLNGQPVQDGLSVYITDPKGMSKEMPINIEGDKAWFVFQGIDQKYTGVYTINLYYNKGLADQAVVDWDAVELVPRTKNE